MSNWKSNTDEKASVDHSDWSPKSQNNEKESLNDTRSSGTRDQKYSKETAHSDGNGSNDGFDDTYNEDLKSPNVDESKFQDQVPDDTKVNNGSRKYSSPVALSKGNYNNVSYSPLQGYCSPSTSKKYSSDYRVGEYFEPYDSNFSSKNSLPNDSWHYQIQLHRTMKTKDEGQRTLDLDLTTFKTEKCEIESKHNPKHCKYYHSLKDRRRGHMNYSTDLCRFAETDKCMKGDKCFLAHSNVERLYHPEKYKTKFWDYFGHDVSKCEYGNFWSFVHCLSEIKIDLIHRLPKDTNFFMFYFKTEWCPFRKDHHKADCVYAHNWQDFRRKPHLFQYQKTKCDNWRSARYITKYSEGWVHMENCIHSHGWKEEFYHPLSYKVHPCREK